MEKRALVIDDDNSILELLRFQLEAEGLEVFTANNGSLGEKIVREYDFDIILTDLNLPDISGIELVKNCKEIDPHTEIIMITGAGSASKAVDAIKAGAFYYVEKPFDFEELFPLIQKALERREQANEIAELRDKLEDTHTYAGIIGTSKAMQEIFEVIENVAKSDANILILGESGTGKEVIANAVHFKSDRSKKHMVSVNCAALPKELIESHLFGHIKGAFTGANKEKEGFIGKANGGTLLLDEIAEMPVELQPKLLRVLQEKTYYRVGSETPKETDFRLIAATNRSPFEAIKNGTLREDLYYRINTIEIRVPPLREREEDIPLLAEHFLSIYSEKYSKTISSFSESAYKQMLNYGWRGNVRELQHSIERAVLMTSGNKIEELTFAEPGVDENASVPVQPQSSGQKASNSESVEDVDSDNDSETADAEDFLEQIAQRLVKQLADRETDDTANDDVFRALEGSVVRAALEKTEGNKRAAAELLGVYRPRLYGMIKRHGINK